MPSPSEPLNPSVTSSRNWPFFKCEWLMSLLAWLGGLPGTFADLLSSPITLPSDTTTERSNSSSASRRNWFRRWTRQKNRRLQRCWKTLKKLPGRCCRKMTRFKWPTWEPDQNSLFVRVIKASRLDGFKMALKENMHFTGRLLYVVSYKLFTGIAIYLIVTSIAKILKTPIIYKHAGKVSMNKVPSPAVNVCPSHLYPAVLLKETNRLFRIAKKRGSAIDSFGEKWNYNQAGKLYFYVYKRCQASLSHSRYLGYLMDDKSLDRTAFKGHSFILQNNAQDKDFQKILRLLKKHKATVNCSEILAACRWGPDGTRNCSEIFKVEETESGTCCRLTLIPSEQSEKNYLKEKKNESSENVRKWNIDEHQFVGNNNVDKSAYETDAPWFQQIAGSDSGLTLVLIMETEDMACPINEGNAYMLSVHSHLDMPQTMTNGIPIPPNHEVYINVNADITVADKDIFYLAKDVSQCYSQADNFLKSSSYTQNNCFTECRALLFQNRCNCSKLGTTAGKNESICGPQDDDCEIKLEDELQARGYDEMCMTLPEPMKCYHSCTEVVYNTVVSSSPYFRQPAFVRSLNLTKTQVTSVVRIFFGSDTAEAKEMHQQYDYWEIVGIIGGLLGLMVGADFMTLIHLFYAFCILLKGIWLKWKLANSRVARAFIEMTSILDMVKMASTNVPSEGPTQGPEPPPPDELDPPIDPELADPPVSPAEELNQATTLHYISEKIIRKNIFFKRNKVLPIVIDEIETGNLTEPIVSIVHIDPIEPAEQIESADPEPSDPIEPVNLTDIIESEEQLEPVVSNETVDTNEPGDLVEPAQLISDPLFQFMEYLKVTEDMVKNLNFSEYHVVDISDSEDEM